MAKIGYGYGSECHLLRYLGRHRNKLNREILRKIGRGESIEWLDHHTEWKGLDFMGDRPDLQEAWCKFWPQRGRVHTWDAVAYLGDPRQGTLLLVEAKAHLQEVKSYCRATSQTSLAQIKKAFAETKKALGVPAQCDWLRRYYQYANRLAVLHFLIHHKVSARLLYIYFLGDQSSQKRICPRMKQGWEPELKKQDAYLGLSQEHKLSGRAHKMFLHVAEEDMSRGAKRVKSSSHPRQV